jgi:hypothetical protein
MSKANTKRPSAKERVSEHYHDTDKLIKEIYDAAKSGNETRQ